MGNHTASMLGGANTQKSPICVAGVVTTESALFEVRGVVVLVPSKLSPEQRLAAAISQVTNQISKDVRCPVRGVMLAAAETQEPRCDHEAHKFLGSFLSGDLNKMASSRYVPTKDRLVAEQRLRMVKDHAEECPLARGVIARVDAQLHSMAIRSWQPS